tara:strand:+ start:3592 stop:3765 length:174 start_codon:yes stop_codon:yes gene_type:complete
MIEILIAAVVILFIRNRAKHARYQKQKEEFWREVFRRVEQQRKLDILYGREREDEDR